MMNRWYQRAARFARPLAVAAFLPGILAPAAAPAESFRLLHDGDSVIGSAFYVKTRQQDTLLDIGRHNGLGYDEMSEANPGVDMWVPGAGKEVLVPTRYVLPKAPRQGIVLNLSEKRLYYFPADVKGVVHTYPISIGREGWGTPVGSFHISTKIKDPTWTPPASIRKEHAEAGDPLPTVVPAGPDNPLGQFALRLSVPGYLIHGTNKPWGVGMQVSHGCIRMYPEDIANLFPEVEVNTSVTIVRQPYKLGWLGDELYLEVHATDDKAPDVSTLVPGSIANAEGVVVDWEAVRRARDEKAGLPLLVGSRQGSANWHHLDMIF